MSAPKERPILFSAPMVRAILDGRKTQTRRIINRVNGIGLITEFQRSDTPGYDWSMCDKRIHWHELTNAELLERCLYGKPGDRLWVRESFWSDNETCDHEYCSGCDFGSLMSLGSEYAQIQFVATSVCCMPPKLAGNESYTPCDGNHSHGNWWLSPPKGWDGERYYRGKGNWIFTPTRYFTKHPSIHMPRWASRITLENVSVRVELLQDISEEDAVFEGLKALTKDDGITIKYGIPDRDGYPGNDDHGWHWRDWNTSPRLAYKRLWESINEKGSWDLNPWVWVVEFKKIER
ncbi:MAG: hypothetical protein JSR71_09190 [Proteobacteria bacterium]|nr:hypothetical protein [Pseudomonadota bacterium]